MIQKLGGRPEGVGDQGVDYVSINCAVIVEQVELGRERGGTVALIVQM